MITMLLGGIWHGAAWKFVMWGAAAMAAGFLAAFRADVRAVAQPAPDERVGKINVVGWSWFNFVCFAWIFFRAEDFTVASVFIAGKLPQRLAQSHIQQAQPAMVALIAIGLAGQFLPPGAFEQMGLRLRTGAVLGAGRSGGDHPRG